MWKQCYGWNIKTWELIWGSPRSSVPRASSEMLRAHTPVGAVYVCYGLSGDDWVIVPQGSSIGKCCGTFRREDLVGTPWVSWGMLSWGSSCVIPRYFSPEAWLSGLRCDSSLLLMSLPSSSTTSYVALTRIQPRQVLCFWIGKTVS